MVRDSEVCGLVYFGYFWTFFSFFSFPFVILIDNGGGG